MHEDPIFRSHDRAGMIGYQHVSEGHVKSRNTIISDCK